MAVPGFQQFMLPLLRLAGDSNPHTLGEAREALARLLNLAEDDLRERVPSGQQTKVHNRISWAATYLKKAKLLEAAGRGKIRITPLGLTVLKQPPLIINIAYLEQFDGFNDFKYSEKEQAVASGDTPSAAADVEETPDDTLERSYLALRKQLAEDLLDRARHAPPAFFEELVVDLLVAMGYGGSRGDAGKAVGQSGDGGIDGIIKEDRLGLDAVYVQAKRWDSPVGRPVVQGFAGSLEGVRARKGVLITTSYFAADAKEYVKVIEKRIVLIDGEQLAQYMIDFGIGVAEKKAYVVKRVDEDYFEWE
jgi:restriction system protein